MTDNLRAFRGRPLPISLDTQLTIMAEGIIVPKGFNVLGYVEYLDKLIRLASHGYNVKDHLYKAEQLNLLYKEILIVGGQLREGSA